MGADALYVAMTRGRHTNHIHLHPPTFEPDQQHGPLQQPTEPWTAHQAFIDICHNHSDTLDTAIDRRRQLRHNNLDPAEHERRRLANLDVNVSLAVATGHDTHHSPPGARRSDHIARTRHDNSKRLAELAASREQRTSRCELEPLEEPIADHNVELCARLARLRTPAINRPDNGFELGL